MEFVRKNLTKTHEQIQKECLMLQSYAASNYVIGNRFNAKFEAEINNETNIVWYICIINNVVLFKTNDIKLAYMLIDKERQKETILEYSNADYKLSETLIVQQENTEPVKKPKRKYTRKPKIQKEKPDDTAP